MSVINKTWREIDFQKDTWRLCFTCVVWSQAGRNQQRGNGRKRKDKCLRHLDSDDGKYVILFKNHFKCCKTWISQSSVAHRHGDIKYWNVLWHPDTHLKCYTNNRALCHFQHKVECVSTSICKENKSWSPCVIEMLILLGGGKKEIWHEIWRWSW